MGSPHGIGARKRRDLRTVGQLAEARGGSQIKEARRWVRVDRVVLRAELFLEVARV